MVPLPVLPVSFILLLFLAGVALCNRLCLAILNAILYSRKLTCNIIPPGGEQVDAQAAEMRTAPILDRQIVLNTSSAAPFPPARV